MKNAARLPLENITPFTLLDFPDITACILWFAGCNMKCHYCYNPEIVDSKGSMDYNKALAFLDTRKNLLDGVVFSGGECTRAKGFVDFVETVSSKGFKIKIDTNGSMPNVIQELGQRKLVDYLALDFKAPPQKFNAVTQSKLYHRFTQTLDYLIESDINFEVRTTFHSDLINKTDIEWMGNFLVERGYKKDFYIQQFVNDTKTISELNRNQLFLKSTDFNIENLKVVLRN